ncbi:hypothetical protein GCM10022235_85340 [Kribbella ginsengisoli]|uniref:Secreted protein n=1 Tax=Kribbella ginsengisoli TaxID=363865 RepID=A0ABP6ZAP0_9ACTN
MTAASAAVGIRVRAVAAATATAAAAPVKRRKRDTIAPSVLGTLPRLGPSPWRLKTGLRTSFATGWVRHCSGGWVARR